MRYRLVILWCCASWLIVAMLYTRVLADDYTVVAPGVEANPGTLQPLADESTSIFIRLSGEAALLGDKPVGVWLDGQDISAQCTRRDNVIVCPVPADLKLGLHRVRIAMPRLAGGSAEASWQFRKGEIVPAERRDGTVRLQHNATKHTLYEGDQLEVTMEGPPGGKAVVAAGDRFSMPLAEAAPGTYRGVHDIARGDFVRSTRLSGQLTLPDQRVFRGESDTPIKILGSMFTVRITSPQSGDKVPWDFTISGRTRPRAHVSISPILGVQGRPMYGGLPPAPGTHQSGMGSIEVVADEHGYFSTKFGFPLHIINVRYTFSVSAFDENEMQAVPTSFAVIVGGKRDDKDKAKKP